MKRLQLSILAAFLGLVMGVGCAQKAEIGGQQGPTGQGGQGDVAEMQLNFQVGVAHEGISRAITADTSPVFDNFEFHVLGHGQQKVEQNILKKFDFQTNTLSIDGLADGPYTLYITAVIGDMTADNAEFQTVESTTDVWLRFNDAEVAPLVADYFHTALDFEVADGTLHGSMPIVELGYLSGGSRIGVNFQGRFTEQSTQSIMAQSGNVAVYSAFSLSHQGSEPKAIAPFELDTAQTTEIMLPPTLATEPLEWNFTHTTSSIYNEVLNGNYTANQRVESGVMTPIALDITHKYDQYGVRYFEPTAAVDYGQDGTKFTRIFTTDEDKSYYVLGARSVKLSTMNTTVAVAGAEKPTCKASFFNLIGVPDVSLYASIDGSTSRYHIAQFDTLPPLVELEELALEPGDNIFRTQTGQWHRISVGAGSVLSNFAVEWNGTDTFSQKINEITVAWTLNFSNNDSYYVAFTSGERARECIGMMMNIAWMMSREDYWTGMYAQLLEVNTAKGIPLVYGDSMEEIDWDFYRSEMENYPGWYVGTVPDGRGVAGYGTWYQFSVLEEFIWRYHEWISYRFYTIIHEMGHGWVHNSTANHVSNLVNGGTHTIPGFACDYFSANMANFPIPWRDPLTALLDTHTTKN